MGAQYSIPKPGAEFQVIGAGLPRTGTASFSEALRILLDGPVYHGGTQVTLGPETEIRSMIRLLSHWPPRDPSSEAQVKRILKERLEGFVASTDAPTVGLTEELLELYPNANVICTVRDPEAWEKSMEKIANTATLWFLRFVLFPIPSMRFFVDYINVLRPQWVHLYGECEPPTTQSYYRHIEWLKRVVPPERLVFFDVKDGWKPLCEALGKEVPKDIPFPRINDGAAIDRMAEKMVKKGLVSWAVIFGTLGIAIGAFWVAGSRT